MLSVCWRTNEVVLANSGVQVAPAATIDTDCKSRYGTGCSLMGNVAFKIWKHQGYEDGHHWFSAGASAILTSMAKTLEYAKVPQAHRADVLASMHDSLHVERWLSPKVALMVSVRGSELVHAAVLARAPFTPSGTAVISAALQATEEVLVILSNYAGARRDDLEKTLRGIEAQLRAVSEHAS
eukprot:6321169-Amphidinium_carterae.1